MEQNQKLKEHARSLRKAQTAEENLLWYQFLRRYPCRFRRQYIIGNFIADFYCHQAKLVVELDGGHHYEQENMDYDQSRTQYMESLGLKVLRFSNADVHKNFWSVCEAIDHTVKERTHHHSSDRE